MELAPEDNEPGFKLIQAVDVGSDPHAVTLDAIIPRADAMRLDRVQAAAIAQCQGMAEVALHARPALRRRRKIGPACQFGGVGIDGSLHQRDVRMLPDEMSIFGCEAVAPTDIDGPRLHFLAPSISKQKRFVACSALDDDDALGERALEPGWCFFDLLLARD